MVSSSWGSKLENLRLFGVLQRFGIVYFIVTVLFIFFTCRPYSTPKVRFQHANSGKIQGIKGSKSIFPIAVKDMQ
jgi:hypothetical protein